MGAKLKVALPIASWFSKYKSGEGNQGAAGLDAGSNARAVQAALLLASCHL